MLTDRALQAIRNYMKTHIGYAAYKSGGVEYTVKVNETSVSGDGSVLATFVIPHTSSLQITEVSLYDYNGGLWAKSAINIQRESTSEGILIRFRFSVREELEVS